jgi:hypothetical protein
MDDKYGYDKKQKSVYEKLQKGSGVDAPEESFDERWRKRIERMLGLDKKKKQLEEVEKY